MLFTLRLTYISILSVSYTNIFSMKLISHSFCYNIWLENL